MRNIRISRQEQLKSNATLIRAIRAKELKLKELEKRLTSLSELSDWAELPGATGGDYTAAFLYLTKNLKELLDKI